MVARKRGGTAVVENDESVTESDDTETVSQEEGENELGGTKVSKRAPRPTFELKEIGDEMPAPNKRGGGKGRGKTREYFDAFQKVLELNNGKVYQVAQFYTKPGAQNAKKEIVDGNREIPAGKWEIESRTVPEKGQSLLLARYLGPEDAEDESAA